MFVFPRHPAHEDCSLNHPPAPASCLLRSRVNATRATSAAVLKRGALLFVAAILTFNPPSPPPPAGDGCCLCFPFMSFPPFQSLPFLPLPFPFFAFLSLPLPSQVLSYSFVNVNAVERQGKRKKWEKMPPRLARLLESMEAVLARRSWKRAVAAVVVLGESGKETRQHLVAGLVGGGPGGRDERGGRSRCRVATPKDAWMGGWQAPCPPQPSGVHFYSLSF